MLATSTLPQKKSKNMLVHIEGPLLPGVTSKDIVLHICGVIGTAGGTVRAPLHRDPHECVPTEQATVCAQRHAGLRASSDPDAGRWALGAVRVGQAAAGALIAHGMHSCIHIQLNMYSEIVHV